MRAIAACQFNLSRFEAWQRAVAVFTGCVLVALSLWFALRPVALPWPAAAALGVVALASLALGVLLLRMPSVSLRWDGRDWHVGPAGSVGQEPTAGAISVALDLGSWMLLQFRAHDRGRMPRLTWLPVQRRGMESQWHSLRCAVYSPRPALDAAQDAGAVADL